MEVCASGVCVLHHLFCHPYSKPVVRSKKIPSAQLLKCGVLYFLLYSSVLMKDVVSIFLNRRTCCKHGTELLCILTVALNY